MPYIIVYNSLDSIIVSDCIQLYDPRRKNRIYIYFRKNKNKFQFKNEYIWIVLTRFPRVEKKKKKKFNKRCSIFLERQEYFLPENQIHQARGQSKILFYEEKNILYRWCFELETVGTRICHAICCTTKTEYNCCYLLQVICGFFLEGKYDRKIIKIVCKVGNRYCRWH